jgi:adenylosuccinate synthase
VERQGVIRPSVGIGPTYSTKATRSGVRIADVFNQELFETKVRRLASGFQKRFGNLLDYDVEAELRQFRQYRTSLAPFVIDQVPLIAGAKADKLNILIEGANAIMLDIDHGTYPYVTSSNTGLGGVLTGLNIGWRSIKEVIGVVKAYTTRVGSGPFPTEQLNDSGEQLQKIGNEFGATTGRKRRTGWFDAVVVKYSHQINDYTSINLTKLDVLDSFPTLRIAVAYKDKATGKELESFPASSDVLENVEVVYEDWEGWMSQTTKVRKWQDLPEKAQKYVERIEELVGVKVKWIGTGMLSAYSLDVIRSCC